MSEKEEYGVVSSKSILKMLAMNDSFIKKNIPQVMVLAVRHPDNDPVVNVIVILAC
jgi:hypothetical protein